MKGKRKVRYTLPALQSLLPLYHADWDYTKVKAFSFTLSWEQEESYEGDTLVAIWGIDFRHWAQVYESMIPMSHDERLAEALTFYEREFYEPIRKACTFSDCTIVLFDTAVNLGLSRAVSLHQSTHNVERILLKRLAHYAEIGRLPNYSHFVRGWVNRIVALHSLIS